MDGHLVQKIGSEIAFTNESWAKCKDSFLSLGGQERGETFSLVISSRSEKYRPLKQGIDLVFCFRGSLETTDP